MRVRTVIVSYLTATLGLLLVALGVALSIMSNLGTGPLSCPAYVLNGIGGLTVGNWTIIVNMSYILVQLAVFRKNFKMKYLMQIPASLVFGYLIDFCLFCIRWLHPAGFASRILICLAACIVTAFGVSIEVVARAWMLSAEMTVYAISKTFRKPFGSVKVAMDSSLVVIASLMAFLIFRNPFGFGAFEGILPALSGSSDGIVIGVGTLLLAVLAGSLMKFTDPLADRFMDWVFSKMQTSRD